MRLLEKLHWELQPYAARPSKFQKAVGYLAQHIDSSCTEGDIYRVEYLVTMQMPQFNSTPPEHAERMGHLYAQERALLSYIISNGSLYCQDPQMGYGSDALPKLNETNFNNSILRYLKEPMDYLNKQFIELFVKWVKPDNIIDNRWFNDYHSYTFLHNVLSKFFGTRCHGMSHAGQSPSRVHNKVFTAKPMRQPDEIHERFQAFLTIKQAIVSQIHRAKFNIIECQYGFQWKHNIKEWLLEIEVVYTPRFWNARPVLQSNLKRKFDKNLSLIHI